MALIDLLSVRTGGPDGIAGQFDSYISLIQSMGHEVRELTGCDEGAQFGRKPNTHEIITIPEASYYEPLKNGHFMGQFLGANDVPNMEFNSWKNGVLKQKDIIKGRLIDTVGEHDGPLFVFNAMVLWTSHPALYLALRELMDDIPNLNVISHSADPLAERPQIYNSISPEVLEFMLDNEHETNGGPIKHPRVNHINLNYETMGIFLKYGVSESNITVIPDFTILNSDQIEIKESLDDKFLENLSKRALVGFNGKKTYGHVDLTDKTKFAIAGVRTVGRKRLKEGILAHYMYGQMTGHDVAFVVTHPDIDGVGYHKDVVGFANDIGVKYIYLGDEFTHEGLDTFYQNMFLLDAGLIVSSSQGGFENVYLDGGKHGLATVGTTKLNSFDILSQLGYQIHGMSFDGIEHLVKNLPVEELAKLDPQNVAEVEGYTQYLDGIFDDPGKERTEAKVNYRIIYDNFSQHSTMKKFAPLLDKVI
tara:strand:+ start:86 stop:1513 length:1428 start_codon:yes stop_codon:yes gene_type:complete